MLSTYYGAQKKWLSFILHLIVYMTDQMKPVLIDSHTTKESIHLEVKMNVYFFL